MNTEESSDRPPIHPVGWYAEHLTADVDRFATVLEAGPLDAAVPACGDWDIRQLATHFGVVLRWARQCMLDGAPPDSRDAFMPPADSDGPGLAAWLREGGGLVAETLLTLDPDGATWHPFPGERINRVWPRRMAHEAAVHRWDAEHAARDTDRTSPIDATLASDGIDEYFDLVIRRRVSRDDAVLPTGSLHVHCTDVAGEWLVWTDDGDYHVVRAHQKGDAALRGPAEAVLLRLWGRDTDRADELSPVGDESVLDAWLQIAGM